MERVEDDRHLAMRIDRDGFSAIAWSPSSDGSLESLRCDFDATSGAKTLRSLEEAVYANRGMLLDVDYRKVWCLDGEAPMMALPGGVAEDEARSFFHYAYPEASENLSFWEVGHESAIVIASALTADVASFLRRTFYNAVVMPPMVVLARYFMRREMVGNVARIFVNLRGSALDIIAIDRGKPLLFNTFAYTTVDDAVYYILAVRSMLGFENRSDAAVMLSGPAERRGELSGRLKEFTEGVFPAVFPSEMYRAGVGSLDIPFELTITSLCG